jgi:hypothetical protein
MNTIKSFIRSKFEKEINNYFTSGRREQGLKPLTNAEINNFIYNYNSLITKSVNEMYNEYLNDGELDNLMHHSEPYWFRSYLGWLDGL